MLVDVCRFEQSFLFYMHPLSAALHLVTLPSSYSDKRDEMLNEFDFIINVSDNLRNDFMFLVISVHVNKALIKMLIKK
jgi:hypothetical protein